jgi:MTH538 TIR-like domain (DUF1863)/PDZ domain
MADSAEAQGAEAADKPFLYDAFISYRHVDRDRKWAEWLIAALEGYRVPKVLQHRGLPPRLRKVFRDEDELPSSADLNDQIRDALAASRFLIVVCSAFTPRSKWVEREIQIFNELGRSDQVLALLTEGEPGDSFPDAMLVRHREVVDPDGSKRIAKEDKEPLAADVRPRPGVSTETSKRMALLRLVSVILGVKFDDLRQREHERERKRHLTWMAVAAALVLLIGGGGGIYWNTARPKTTYYRQLVWRWGLPEGAFTIDAATHDRLSRSYSVITQRGKVVEVRCDSWVHADEDGQARWIVRYADDGSAQKIQIFGATGRLLRDDVLSGEDAGHKMIVSFTRGDVPLAQDATHNLISDPTNGTPAPVQAKSEITRHELTFDDNGFPVEVRYQDNWGTPQHDAQDSFGERYIYSAEGQVLRSTEVGPNGEEITLKNGVHAVTSSYDGKGRLVRRTLLGEGGGLINGPDGFAYFVRDYAFGDYESDVAQIYYGADAKPTLSVSGYSKLVGLHDAHGNNTEVAYYDVDGKPTPYKDGYAQLKRRFDDRGYVIEEAFFDINGQPTVDSYGRASDRLAYDQRGNLTDVAYFSVDGKPTLNKSGFAKMIRSFDEHANMLTEAYFDVDGKPTVSNRKYASVRQMFNQRDERTEFAVFGIDGKPTLDTDGIAKFTYAFDARGNEVQRAFFGVDGKPILKTAGATGTGYAGYRQTFDERGNKTEESYFGVDGAPAIESQFGSAKIQYDFDAHGNIIEMRMFGIDGKPILATGGYATLRLTHDDRGNIIEVRILGTDGEPALSAQGIARTLNSYDSRGNLVERDFSGRDGKPTVGTFGYASFQQKYDDRGNVIEISYFDPDGKPIPSVAGYAGMRQAFDERRKLIELVYFGTDGKPILSNEKIARLTHAYDAHGNEVERAYFGTDGKPTLSTSGYAGFRQAFDARNNVVTKTFFGIDGKPIPIRDGGYATITWTYDPRGDLITESYFGVDGQPAQADGCVTIKYAYDKSGHQTKVICLDVQDHEFPMGLVVRSVVPGGTGALAGLAPGDRILAYNNQPVTSTKQLTDLVDGPAIFRAVTVRRGSKIVTLAVPAGSLSVTLGLVRRDASAGSEDDAPAASAAPSR